MKKGKLEFDEKERERERGKLGEKKTRATRHTREWEREKEKKY